MAHVLFLTQLLPYPLDAGPKVRAYHMLRHLAGQHHVTLVSFVRDEDTAAAVAHLADIVPMVYTVPMRRSPLRNFRAGIKGLLTGQPMVIARDEMAEMAQRLRKLTHETTFDVIHADQLSMAGYGQMAARFSELHRPQTVLDEHNAVYLLVERMAAHEPQPLRRALIAREARAFRRYEAAMCRAYDAILTVTTEDRDRLLALCPAAAQAPLAEKFALAPICVDPEWTLPVTHRPGSAPTILHLGTMFWPPNVAGVLWFAREVLPLIHTELPTARFVVVGKNPPPEVLALRSDARIEVVGYAPDATPYFADSDAFVVPLFVGGGMRVKILDAWLRALPIVSTPIGAEGIAVRDGENILIAVDAATFAAAVLRLLVDPELNARLRAAGRAWVEKKYTWQVTYRRVDEVYGRLLSS